MVILRFWQTYKSSIFSKELLIGLPKAQNDQFSPQNRIARNGVLMPSSWIENVYELVSGAAVTDFEYISYFGTFLEKSVDLAQRPFLGIFSKEFLIGSI